MASSVTITTGARLHFGLLANAPGQGRRFGGAGLMIDRPGFTLAATQSDRDEVCAPVPYVPRIEQFVKTYRRSVGEATAPIRCRLELRDVIPAHAGLGSGTQLGMAVAQALAIVSNEGQARAVDLAQRVGRGLRSALGIHGFERGGFLVEGGKLADDRIGPLITRAVFPDEWRILLVCPQDEGGLSGEAEMAAFAELAPMPAETTARLCAVLVMELLPAILEADFEACGDALFRFGALVGDYFSPVQNGIYASPGMSLLAEHLRTIGIRGVGQTSWGPTLFVLCRGERQAADLAADLESTRWGACKKTIAAPLNSGAAIEIGR